MATLHTPSEQKTDSKSPAAKKFVIPDIYVILGAMVLIVAVLSYIMPAGEYARTMVNGRSTVVPGSFQFIEQTPLSFMQIMSAIPDGMVKAADVVILTLLVGGAVGVIRMAGVINYAIDKLLAALGARVSLIMFVLVFIFSLIAAFVGTPELGIAYLPIVLPLMLRLGYDTTSAVAIALLGPSVGFAFALTAPATIGTSHIVGQLPMFSGAGYRAIFLVVSTLISIAYLMRYAARVKADPARSLTPELDATLRSKYQAETNAGPVEYTVRQRIAAVATLVMFIAIIWSILQFKLGFVPISGLFMGMAVVCSLIVGQRLNDICSNYNEAMRGVMVGALICGVARGVSVALENGHILDTMVYYLAQMLSGLPTSLTAIGIWIVEWAFNLVVPSGAGKAVITLPVFFPLADLVGLHRQVVVLGLQWGDGLANLMQPTEGYFMAIIAMAGLPFGKWLKFYLPLFAILGAVCIIGLLAAVSIGLN
ncbi:YfcC family protein [Microvirgula aerodenitrificans]|uniref:YfcC family protein n=1 Tax=Microvirgula aerodenitrificans TaxID=57480 RepID=UPI00248E38F6|nr:AbgT family transporter [Microvirgula aerodenitrificans]